MRRLSYAAIHQLTRCSSKKQVRTSKKTEGIVKSEHTGNDQIHTVITYTHTRIIQILRIPYSIFYLSTSHRLQANLNHLLGRIQPQGMLEMGCQGGRYEAWSTA